RVVGLAGRTAALVAAITGDDRLAARAAELRPHVRMVGGVIGRGYGHVTEGGLAAASAFRAAGGPPLDPTYSAKAADGMPRRLLARGTDGPTLFWAPKSSRPLPEGERGEAPPPLARWLARQ